jgi:phospholipase/carboxylesterase
VPTAIETQLISFNGWTLRVHASRSVNPRLLLLLHGWTGDENSMWLFTRRLSSVYWMIAPRAPHPAEPEGFSWRSLVPSSFGFPAFEDLAPAAGGLLRLVDEYSASVGVNAAQFDLMGFSQGAAMVGVMATLYPERIRRAAILAGFVPDGLERFASNKPLAGKTFFMAHGAQDQIIPLERAMASKSLLEEAGAQILWCEDKVGHKLGVNCLLALEDYLNA